MNPYVAYDAVSTKVKSKRGRLLDKKDWDNILDCTSVEQVTNLLKDRPELAEIIKEADSDHIHRDDLETILGRFRVSEIEDILHYFSGPYKSFLQTVLFEFEIADLILIIRKVAQNESMGNIKKHFIHSENYSELSYDKLIASSNITDLIENLKDSSYYSKFRSLSNEDIIKREFHIEMKLQIHLYNLLLKKSKKLSTSDMEEVEDILGVKIDFANVQWIYRAMKYFNISPEEILIYCLPGGKRISYPRLKKLCYAKSIEEVKSLSKNYLKYNIFTSPDDSEIDIKIDSYIYNYLDKKDMNKKTIGTALAYFYMNSIIVKDLIAVTEGIKYQLPKEKLKKYLVHAI